MNCYLKVLQQYAVFSGRASRCEYWSFTLISFALAVVLAAIDGTMGTFNQAIELGPLSGFYIVGTLLPSIAVGARRLHDAGYCAWWLVIGVIPYVGTIVLLIFAVLPPQAGINQYGQDPKVLGQ